MLFALAIAMSQSNVVPRGPILYSDRAPIVGRQSVQSPVAPIAVKPTDRGPGVGLWIWPGWADKTDVVRFRKTISLDRRPIHVRGWITAEVRYRMWINGRLAARGPADAGRDYDSGPCGPWFEDVRDLSRFFHRGTNTVAVEVFRSPLVSSDATIGHPGLKADFQFENGNGKTKTVGTDATWMAAPAPDLDQQGATNGYRIDLRQEPNDWREATFDDSTWKSAEFSPGPERPTLVSELAPPMEAILPPKDIVRATPGVTPNPKTGGAKFESDSGYTVRYGHILAGYVGMRVRGHRGARLLLMPNEHDAPGANRRAEIVLREGEQTFELPYFDSYSVINIQAVGVTKPIEIEDVRCVFTSYPVRYLGSFECSDPNANRIWEICRWVTQICMQTHHLDSPHHQEPISDAGDYLIESLNALYAFGDGTLARQDLKKIARTLIQRKYQSFHTSYSLLWLRMLMQYEQYTGDSETVRQLSPTVFALLDRFKGYIGKNGLISEAPNYMFMDWVEIEGFNAHHPPAVIGQGYMSALYYQALADGMRVAVVMGDTTRRFQFVELRAQLRRAFDRELWSPKKGLYRDGKPFQTTVPPNQWLPADKPIETFTTQVNTLAVACGLTDPERSKQVMQAVLGRHDLNCQPYFMHFVFEATDRAGLFNQDAKRQLDRWKIVPDTQSFHEMWDVGDLSHAWNATPLYQMSGLILGVRPTQPGFWEFTIVPHPAGLSWARGVVPTPHGPIQAEWKRVGTSLELRFVVPDGTRAIMNGASYGPGAHSATIKGSATG
ncbi:MAG: alpha-L-rhamnosidase C-terminal domain-containing protein [Fimbriimonas sp.]|nr:alpha-L-rhamnosidase C-terminal domain-containing protein [Fimbriimonas sp.]